tara:strand:- start:2210 stop:2866 length:657 start_codon:yes stop_codon:yes gene_type:complete
MTHFTDSTRPSSDRTTKMITLDSADFFYNKNADTECKFEVDLETPLHIPNPSMVYLESIHIGAFKINETKKLFYPSGTTPFTPSNISKDIVTHFNFNIPELGITTHAGSLGTRTTPFNGCFTLPNERPARPATGGTLLASDYQPYFLGHLSRTAVYITSMQPKTLSRFTITITDQNGDSIWKAVEPGTTTTDLIPHGLGNPPLATRRIIMQLIVAENS